jgi:hypothetical protein
MRIERKFLIGAILLSTAACRAELGSSSIEGVVIDLQTGRPISGAVVWGEWWGHRGGPVQSTSVCYHTETAVSDEQGRFHIPSWKEANEADLMASTVPDQYHLYASAWGFKEAALRPNNRTTLYMEPDGKSRQKRFQELAAIVKIRPYSFNCPDDQELHGMALSFRGTYKQVQAIAETGEEQIVLRELAKRVEELSEYSARPSGPGKRFYSDPGRKITAPEDAKEQFDEISKNSKRK